MICATSILRTMSRQLKNEDGEGGMASARKLSRKKQGQTKAFFRSRTFGAAEPTLGECMHCHRAVPAGAVVCPHCGRSLTPGKCSFCGAAMPPAAKFCTQCGQSREGVVCPVCGTLNARNFCRKCNAPLTPRGQLAQEAARNDPAFRALQAKAADLAALHARIEALRENGGQAQGPSGLSESDRALLDEYADVLQSMGVAVPEVPAVSRVEEARRPSYDDAVVSLDELMEAYREKAAEMNAELEAMAPPPDFTPEQQRDYYAARKMATLQTEYDMSDYQSCVWQCNYCGAYHQTPSACVQPELGGTWVYITPEQYIEQNQAYIVKQQTLKIE